MEAINYGLLDDAVQYYINKGYTFIDLEWTASERAIAITLPESKTLYEYGGKYLIGSAEQSFLDEALRNDSRITPGINYVAVTPCWRDEEILDQYTRPYFMKVELFCLTSRLSESEVQHPYQFAQDAKNLFSQFIPGVEEKWMLTPDYETQQDLMTPCGIELGSYGFRCFTTTKTLHWQYGTGLAEPRFSECFKKYQGYHENPIVKQSDPVYKILEEAQELIDATNQGSTIMQAVELSDLYLSIKRCAKSLGIEFSQIEKMAELTNRAFETGHRS